MLAHLFLLYIVSDNYVPENVSDWNLIAIIGKCQRTFILYIVSDNYAPENCGYFRF